MKIFGKEFGLAKTVSAVCTVQKMAREADPDKGVLFTPETPYEISQMRCAVIISALHDGYIAKKHIEDLQNGIEPKEEVSLSPDELLGLDNNTFNKLFIEAWTLYNTDTSTVKTSPAAGKKTEKAKAQ